MHSSRKSWSVPAFGGQSQQLLEPGVAPEVAFLLLRDLEPASEIEGDDVGPVRRCLEDDTDRRPVAGRSKQLLNDSATEAAASKLGRDRHANKLGRGASAWYEGSSADYVTSEVGDHRSAVCVRGGDVNQVRVERFVNNAPVFAES